MHEFVLSLAFAIVPVIGCSEKPQTAKRSSSQNQEEKGKLQNVATADEAIRTFQRLWRDNLAQHLTDEQRRYTDHVVAKVRSGKEVSARFQSLQECFSRVDGTLTDGERKKLILHGSISDLEGLGSCWAIETHGGLGNDLCAYIDTRGKLVFVWIVPEG